jgi:beta-glucosidase
VKRMKLLNTVLLRLLLAISMGLIGAYSRSLYAQSKLPYLDPSLPTQERVDDLISRMTLDEKVSQMMNDSPAIPRLGIPKYDWWTEGLHGVAQSPATLFPQAIGLAATWDAPLIGDIADTISMEARAKYNQAIRDNIHARYFGLTIWSPNINIFRDPRWGRGQETYGEDPYLTSRLGVEFVRGLQGTNPKYLKTVATPKHFAVHSGPESERHRFNVDPSPHDLEDTYLPAFRATIVKGHADSMMCSYNAINGIPSCANKLLADVVRGKWDFHGYITSDCNAIRDFYSATGHHYSPDAAHASAIAVLAGTDTDCGRAYQALPQAVKEGLISEKDIDVAVKRLFTARVQLGMFDPAGDVPFDQVPYSEVDSAANRAQALKAARESMVLLKNEKNTLPLKDVRTIAVVGPNAVDLAAVEGNYNATPSHPVFPLEGIEAEFPKAKVLYGQGSPYVEQFPLPVPRTALRPFEGSTELGLTGKYFNNSAFTGEPVLTRIDKQVDFNWSAASPGPGVPANDFGVRWTGTIAVPKPGDYPMEVGRVRCYQCNDRETFTVWLDGREVATAGTDDREHRWSNKGPIFHLKFSDTEPHTIRVDYSHHSVLFGAGVTLNWVPPVNALRENAVQLAQQSDVVVAFMGLSPNLEGEEMSVQVPGFSGGDRTAISLPDPQQQLLHALAATGKPLVVVLMNGSALAVDWAQQHAQAILEAWYPGEAGGQAIAETLDGKNDPGGKLPITFYASLDQLPSFTDYSMKNRTYRYFHGKPLYEFGYGLSFTRFDYRDVRVSDTNLKAGDPLIVEADVQNTGPVAGDTVSELYLIPPQNGINPLRELEGFRRLHLKPGESQHVKFTLDPRRLSLVDAGGKRSVQPGTYTVFVGGNQPTGKVGQTAQFTIHGVKALPE